MCSRGRHPPGRGAPRHPCLADFETKRKIGSFPNVMQNHPDTYRWRTDAFDSYTYALRMKALAIGSRRFATLPEMYWQESHGQIP